MSCKRRLKSLDAVLMCSSILWMSNSSGRSPRTYAIVGNIINLDLTSGFGLGGRSLALRRTPGKLA